MLKNNRVNRFVNNEWGSLNEKIYCNFKFSCNDNDNDLGYLSQSDTHWLTEQFNGNNEILNLNDNTLKIQADIVGSNYDDVEFTNLYLNYTAVPIHGALWLLGSGLIGMGGIRKKFKK